MANMQDFIKMYIREYEEVSKAYQLRYCEKTEQLYTLPKTLVETKTSKTWYCSKCCKEIKYQSAIIYHIKSYHKDVI